MSATLLMIVIDLGECLLVLPVSTWLV